jgi:hypothetical protein
MALEGNKARYFLKKENLFLTFPHFQALNLFLWLAAYYV